MTPPHSAGSAFSLAPGAGLLMLCFMAGCAPLPPEPAAPVARATAISGLAEDSRTPLPDSQWWREFGDPALDALVDSALAGQPTLAAAGARLARADALRQQSAASDRPVLGLAADGTEQRYSENGLVPPAVAGTVRGNYTVQLAASWELDFFGRHRAALQSALGLQRAAQAEQQAARMLLAAQVARSWVGLARLAEQQRLAGQQHALRSEMLELTRQRLAAGLDSELDLIQAASALPELRQQSEALAEQMALMRNQLAALSAQPPQALADAQPRLAPLRLPELPPRLGLDLLGRRAEVVAARWRVEAATQDVALARAQFMPDLNLLGFAGFSALGLERLFDFGSRQAGVGAAFRLPIFDGGRLQANLQLRHADLGAAVAAYDSAVLEAVHEAADALASVQSVQRQRQAQDQVLAAAEAAWRLGQQRRRAGVGGQLPVLALDLQRVQQQRLQADLRSRALEAQVQLMRALGGGYQEEPAR